MIEPNVLRSRLIAMAGYMACLLSLFAFSNAGWAATGAAGEIDLPDVALEERVGHAFDLNTGDPVYREYHDPEAEDGRLVGDRVTYRAPDGEVFARKTVDYRAHPIRPSFRLSDERSGYLEGLRVLDDGRVELFHRAVGAEEVERSRLEPPAGLVADAGYDILVAREFDRLLAGETVQLPFAVPSRGDWYNFRARVHEETELFGRPAVVIRLELAGWLGRLLTDPIEITYSRDNASLLRYQGISNIRDAQGESLQVRIDFPGENHEPEPPK